MEARIHQHRVRVRRKRIVLNGHPNQQQGQILNFLQHACQVLVVLVAQAFPNQVHIRLVNVIGRNEIHFEFELLQELFFATENLLLSEGAVGDFLCDDLRVQRVDVFIF